MLALPYLLAVAGILLALGLGAAGTFWLGYHYGITDTDRRWAEAARRKAECARTLLKKG